MNADDLSRIAMSSNLSESLSRGADYARQQGHIEVSLEHMLLSLCEDPDARLVLAASNIDLTQLTNEVLSYLAGRDKQMPPGQNVTPAVSADLRRILDAAAAAARGGRRREINGAIVLAAIVGDGKSPAAQLLRAQGLTFEGAIKALQRGPGTMPQGRSAASAEDILADARARVQSRTAPPRRVTHAPPTTEPVTQPPAEPAPPPPPEPVAEEPDEAAPPPAPMPPAPEPQPEPSEPAAQAGQESHKDRAPPEAWQEPAPPAEEEGGISSLDDDAMDVFEGEEDAGPPPTPASAPFPPPVPVPEPSWTPPPAADHGERSYPSAGPPPLPSGGFAGSAPPPLPPAPARDEWPEIGASGETPSRAPPSPPWPQPGEPQPRRPRGVGAAPPSGAPAGMGPLMSRTRGMQNAAAPDAGQFSRPAHAQRAEIGQLVENIPRTMRVAVPALIEVRIARANVQALAEGLQGSGAAFHHQVAVTKAMSVRLRAPDGGFFIETASPETQWIETSSLLSGDDYASWRWHVTPRVKGRKRLQLVISARTVSTDGLAAETALPDQVITVRVRTNYAKVASRWSGWVVAAIAGGLLARFGEGAFDAGKEIVTKLMAG